MISTDDILNKYGATSIARGVSVFGVSVFRIPQKNKESSTHLFSCGHLGGVYEVKND